MKIRKPKNINERIEEKLTSVVKKIKDSYNRYMEMSDEEFAKLHVCISGKNLKMGDIPSVSLPPIVACGNCSECMKMCYYIKTIDMYKNSNNSAARNLAILNRDREKYFREVDVSCKISSVFRFHVGGDIYDYDYFVNMCKVAENNPHCKMMCFTKMYDIVNEYLDNGNGIPHNLQIIFSGWKGITVVNPFKFPECHPVFVDGYTDANEDAHLCTGNCTECFIENKLCWNLSHGEQIKINVH